MKTGRLWFFLISFLITTWSVPGLSATARYVTGCEIRGGVAYGSVSNLGDSFEIDGYLWFHFYNNRGDLIDSEDEYEYEYVSSRSTEEIEQTNAPSRATRCSFDISGAVVGESDNGGDDGSSGELDYRTTCEIRGGTAYGGVHNDGDAFEVDGTIWFYFFNSRGDLIDDEDDYEYEYVSSRSFEEIDSTSAPSNAARCSFSIDDAVSR